MIVGETYQMLTLPQANLDWSCRQLFEKWRSTGEHSVILVKKIDLPKKLNQDIKYLYFM